MRNIIPLLLLLILIGCASPIRVLHYNIKEYDTRKIRDKDSAQNKALRKIIDQYPFDILSLNEVHYDIPYRQNLDALKETLDLSSSLNESFHQANTGNNADKTVKGLYLEDFSRADSRKFADPVNFGIFPGQYSTAALFKYKKIREVIITDLPWKKFNPNRDLSKFRDAAGGKLPEDMPLFDKNFSDIVVKIKDKEVHLILLHAVPAYHFGNKKSPNYQRNADQLRFLEWYLTGSTDFEVPKDLGITPLSPTDYMIAMGDWNTALDHKTNPGSEVLRRIFEEVEVWTDDLSFTHEGGAFKPKPFRLMLDYIAYRGFKLKKGEILHPNFEVKPLGCGIDEKSLRIPAKGKVRRSYYDNETKLTCWVVVDQSYADFIDASDHYPIYAEFELL